MFPFKSYKMILLEKSLVWIFTYDDAGLGYTLKDDEISLEARKTVFSLTIGRIIHAPLLTNQLCFVANQYKKHQLAETMSLGNKNENYWLMYVLVFQFVDE